MTNVPIPKFEAHSEPCKLREQALNDLEFDLRDLKYLRLGLLRSTEKLIELAQEKLRNGKSLAELLEVPQGKKISSVDFSPIRLSKIYNIDSSINNSEVNRDMYSYHDSNLDRYENLDEDNNLLSKDKMSEILGKVDLELLYPEDFPKIEQFKHEYLKGFDKTLLNSKFWELLEFAAEAESAGFKVGSIMRFEDGDIKGNLWCDSEKLRKMGKNKRLKELYDNLVAASSENLIDFAGRMQKQGLMKIACSEQETRNQEFWFKVRRKNEKLFERRKNINGFSVICPDYVKCIDVDATILSATMKNYVSAGFIQHSPSGNGRFHAFVLDKTHIMNKFNSKPNGFDVLQGNNQIFFQAVRNDGSFMYPIMQGKLSEIGNLSPQIEELIDLKFSLEDWHGKKIAEDDYFLSMNEKVTVATRFTASKMYPSDWELSEEMDEGEDLVYDSVAHMVLIDKRRKQGFRLAMKQVKLDSAELKLKKISKDELYEKPDYSLFKSANQENYDRTFYEGERNVSLFKFGRSLRCKGYTENVISEKVWQANAEKCSSPLPESEVEHIIKSVIRLENQAGFIQYVPLFSKDLYV